MRPSHHADESILRMHVRQVRELELGTLDPTTTCTVKALLEHSPNCCLCPKTTTGAKQEVRFFLRVGRRNATPTRIAQNARSTSSEMFTHRAIEFRLEAESTSRLPRSLVSQPVCCRRA